MMPRSSDPEVGYEISRLSTGPAVLAALREVGKYAAATNHSLSFHPGPFVCLGSPDEAVRNLGVLALERENEVADALCTNADLDICHGHSHGALGYHYHATIEYPYTIGCYRGTPR